MSCHDQQIAALVTLLIGSTHGHAGVVLSDTKHTVISPSTTFDIAAHPGVYQITMDDDIAIQRKQ